MEIEITLNPDEAIDYLKNEVKAYDILELSYNKVFIPGEVIDIEEDFDGNEEGLILSIQMNGELLNDTIQINLLKIKDEILEIRHTTNEELTVIVVDE